MKTLLLPAAAALLIQPFSAPLATDYKAGKTVKITSTTEYSMEVVDFEMLVDGEPMEGRGGGDRMTTESRTIEQTDEWLAAENGSLTKLKRSFASIEGGGTMTFGENEMENEREAPLSGVTLMMERGEEGLTVEVTDGTEPDDEALLEGHEPELALDGLLPEGDLAEGAEYKLDQEAIFKALGLDLESKYFPRPQREEGAEGEGRGRGGRGGRGMRGGGRSPFQPFNDIEWEGKATVASMEADLEGDTCVKIALEIKGEGELPERERGERRGGRGRGGRALELATPAPIATNYEVKLEGALYFSTTHKMPVRLELEGSLSQDRETERSRGERSMTIISLEEGELTHVVSIEVEAKDK